MHRLNLFSSTHTKQEKAVATKKNLTTAQYVFLGLSLCSFYANSNTCGSLLLATSLLFERAAAEFYKYYFNDQQTAQYISSHYSNLTQLTFSLPNAVKKVSEAMSEDIRYLRYSR